MQNFTINADDFNFLPPAFYDNVKRENLTL